MRVLTFHYSATMALHCDGCKASFKGMAESSQENSFKSLEVKVRRDVKYEAFSKGWVFKSEGSKGVRHYCPKCMKRPELAAWHMEKILTRK